MIPYETAILVDGHLTLRGETMREVANTAVDVFHNALKPALEKYLAEYYETKVELSTKHLEAVEQYEQKGFWYGLFHRPPSYPELPVKFSPDKLNSYIEQLSQIEQGVQALEVALKDTEISEFIFRSACLPHFERFICDFIPY